MHQKKTLVLIREKAQAALLPHIKRKLEVTRELVIVAYDIPAEEKLKQLGQGYKRLGDYPLELDRVFTEANSIAKEWHRKFSDQEFKELVNYSGVPIGIILEYWLGRTMSESFRDLQIVLNLVNHEKPQEIVTVSDGGTLAAASRLVSKYTKTKLLLFPPGLKMKTRAAWAELKSSVMWTSYYFLRRLRFSRPQYIRSLPADNRSSVLLISTYGVHSSILKPVIKELQGQARVLFCDLQLIPLTLKRLSRILKTAANPSNYLSYNRLAGLAGMRRRRRKLKRKWQRLCQRDDFKDSFNYRGMPVWTLIAPLFNRLFETILPDLIEYIELTNGLLKRERVGVIVTCDDLAGDMGAIIIAARKQGIPSLMLQIGVLQARNLTDAYAGLSNKIAVWGDVARDFFLSQGVPDDKVIITGSPQFDMMLETVKKRPVKKKPGYTVVLATQPFDPSLGESPAVNRTFAEAVVRAVEQINSARLIIKLHPNEWRGVHRRIYDSIERKAGGKVKILVDANLHRLLAEADLVITKGSTVGLEAMLLGKPVIEADFTGRLDNTPQAVSGAALRVSTEEELGAAIQRVLFDAQVQKQMQEAAKDYIYKQAYLQDRQASRRTTELIISMLNKEG